MSLFDKLFKKEKVNEKKEPPKGEALPSCPDILNETFQGCYPVTGGRNKEICDRFVARGIAEFAENRFDEKGLAEISFDEFCHIYNTVGWYVKNIMPGVKDTAEKYKAYLRPKLLKRLSSFPVYAIYAKPTALPYVMQDGSMLLFTAKEIAKLSAESSDYDWLEVYEITPGKFNACFSEYFITGYWVININGETKVKIEDFYETKPLEEYKNTCVEACMRMTDFKQSQAMIKSNAERENRSISDEEKALLQRLSGGAANALLKNTLLVPADAENGKTACTEIEDGKKFAVLFTDKSALCRCFGKSACSPALIRDVYDKIKDDFSVSGIIINPGREEFVLTKEIFAQLCK